MRNIVRTAIVAAALAGLALGPTPARCQATPSPPSVWFPPAALTYYASPYQPPPAISAGPVVIQNGQFTVGGKPYTFWGCNWDQYAVLGSLAWQTKPAPGYVISPAACALIRAHLDNCVAAGFRAVRIHGLDESGVNSIFWPQGPQPPPGATGGQITQGSTRRLDPMALAALDFFLGECQARNLRVCLTLNFTRQLTVNDRPEWPCQCFDECLANGFGSGKGFFYPWIFLEQDGGLAALQQEYARQLLRWTPPSLGVPLGDSPVLLAVILQNEQTFVRWIQKMPSTLPILSALWGELVDAFKSANGITAPGPYAVSAQQYAQLAAQVDRDFLVTQTASVRQLTRAVIIPATYFGNVEYPMLVGPAACAAADPQVAFDAHFYSRSALTDSNGFLNGRTSTDARTRFAAVLAGCSWKGTNGYQIPLCVTEYGFAGQVAGQPLDPDSERAVCMPAIVSAAIRQNAQAMFLYSYAHGSLFLDLSPYAKAGAYDRRFDAQLLAGVQTQAALFHAPRKPATPTTVTLTPKKLYGDFSVSPHSTPGPDTDNDLYAIPAAQPVLMVPQ